MARISPSRVQSMLINRMAPAARKAGLDPDGWRLDYGTKASGVPWSLVTPPPSGCTVLSSGTMMLGGTAAEAWQTLWAMAVAWEAVAERGPENG